MNTPTMRIALLLLLIFPAFQLLAQQKHVVSQYDDGTAQFVVWMKGKKGAEEIVKEEAYYPNGSVEYSGHYKDGVEHGVWTYYYENGNKQVEEHYEKGVEHGIRSEYALDGSLRVEFHYDKGRLAKEIRHK